jgi:hypothetical protein
MDKKTTKGASEFLIHQLGGKSLGEGNLSILCRIIKLFIGCRPE